MLTVSGFLKELSKVVVAKIRKIFEKEQSCFDVYVYYRGKENLWSVKMQ